MLSPVASSDRFNSSMVFWERPSSDGSRSPISRTAPCKSEVSARKYKVMSPRLTAISIHLLISKSRHGTKQLLQRHSLRLTLSRHLHRFIQHLDTLITLAEHKRQLCFSPILHDVLRGQTPLGHCNLEDCSNAADAVLSICFFNPVRNITPPKKGPKANPITATNAVIICCSVASSITFSRGKLGA